MKHLKNKLKEEFYKEFDEDLELIGSNSIRYDGDEIGDAIWNWINQNYLSKQQILNLECLKEERVNTYDGRSEEAHKKSKARNQLRKEIKEEIKKL